MTDYGADMGALSQGRVPFDEVEAVDARFFGALLASDAEALEEILDPQFLIVDIGGGNITTRSDFIAAVAERAVTFERIDTSPSESIVRGLGDCRVVVGRTRMRAAMPSGDTVATDSRYTHIFTPAPPGGWRLASAQGTPISKRPDPHS